MRQSEAGGARKQNLRRVNPASINSMMRSQYNLAQRKLDAPNSRSAAARRRLTARYKRIAE
jgi:hypothetical protein